MHNDGMKKSQNGFGLIELLILIVVIGAIGFVGFKVLASKKDKNNAQHYNHQTMDQSQTSSTNTASPLIIKNWPVKIAAYDSSTQLAGDVYMNKDILVNSHLGLEQIPLSEAGRQRTEKNSGKVFTLPTIDFLTRQGAPLFSVSDGYVVSVDRQVENGRDDYEMHVVPEKTGTHQWMVIYDHFINPSVKVGDTVNAGQQIGGTGPVGSGAPYNFIELQVNYNPNIGRQGSSPSDGRCPSSSIASGRKQAMSDELNIITSTWESLTGNSSAYNEAAWVAPGCLSEKVQV
jgi:murein DD-endopeptidase MepM/ murein hydrolase activator NlpD